MERRLLENRPNYLMPLIRFKVIYSTRPLVYLKKKKKYK